MKDFDIAKFLRENQLGSYGILNHYVDIKPLKEEFQLTPDQQRILNQKEEQWREFYKAHDEQHGEYSPYRMPYYSEESFINAMTKEFIDILKKGGDISNLEEQEVTEDPTPEKTLDLKRVHSIELSDEGLNSYIESAKYREDDGSDRDLTPDELSTLNDDVDFVDDVISHRMIYKESSPKLTGNGGGDEFKQADTVSEEETAAPEQNDIYEKIVALKKLGYSSEEIIAILMKDFKSTAVDDPGF